MTYATSHYTPSLSLCGLPVCFSFFLDPDLLQDRLSSFHGSLAKKIASFSSGYISFDSLQLILSLFFFI
ncbi:hypothetical protein QJS04_geneDACA002116 [Acorus gramineus]|uniref:Uncharacterized protein n=1 Tax=Acorus gramineus TaxID=55184 RepID=A0AAV9A7W3_ACOGR|nr:hypothetical protein QJS04_geneDACA002116 [Acorus gramineus]